MDFQPSSHPHYYKEMFNTKRNQEDIEKKNNIYFLSERIGTWTFVYILVL